MPVQRKPLVGMYSNVNLSIYLSMTGTNLLYVSIVSSPNITTLQPSCTAVLCYVSLFYIPVLFCFFTAMCLLSLGRGSLPHVSCPNSHSLPLFSFLVVCSVVRAPPPSPLTILAYCLVHCFPGLPLKKIQIVFFFFSLYLDWYCIKILLLLLFL